MTYVLDCPDCGADVVLVEVSRSGEEVDVPEACGECGRVFTPAECRALEDEALWRHGPDDSFPCRCPDGRCVC